MESRGEAEGRVFDAFRGDGFVELLGGGDFGGVGELPGMEEVEVGRKVPVVEREGDGVGGVLLRCTPAFPPPNSSSPSSSSYRMLCFGGDEGFPSSGANRKGLSQKFSESCSSTSSSSSNSGLSKSKKKTEERGGRSAGAPAKTCTKATATGAAATKKQRKEQPQGQQPPSSQCRASKVRKEKLGERITALQQIVSPFGKTDTASVLHEALGYIRFLHDQVQVLSSPYLERLPSSAHREDASGEAGRRPDLRSRGLCLVPLACTAQVAASNGADFWSPARGTGGGDHHHPGLSKH